ncbi:MAG: response regulator [Desulfobulbaceae bacterium]|nr:response regulator [Desulfobulbaceae bacterium]
MNIKRKTTIIVMAIIAIVSAIHAGATIYWSHHSLAEEQLEHRRLFERSYKQIATRLDNYLSKRINGLLAQKEILQAFHDRDREKLYSLTKQKFQVISKEIPGFPIMHFHTPDHRSFLRLHKPDMHSDDLEQIRPMVSNVIHSRVEAKGFEVGKLTVTYRVVRPVFYEGEFLGVLELGADIKFIMTELQLLFGSPSAFFASRDALDQYELSKNFKEVSGRLLFSTNNEQIFDNIKTIDFSNGGKQQVGHQEYSLLVADPVVGFRGELIGNIVSLQDLKRQKALQHKIIFLTIIMSVFLLILVSVVLENSFGRLIADLEVSNQQAVKAEKAKREFLANMSHEIRTPLNAIIGMTELSLKTPLNDHQQYLLASVKTASNSLLGLLNDILDFSKIEAGQLQLDSHVFSLIALLDALQSIMAVAISDKNLSLQLQTDFTSLPEFVEGDELRLRQVLVNLVNNAIKFTEQGSVTIRIKQEEDSAESSTPMFHFSVIDTGIGIPAAQHKSIFASFQQGDNSTARQFGGTGLGLAICKQLVELMGGNFWLESEEGKGSAFHFTIPLVVSENIIPEHKRQTLAGLNKNLRILLVEDNMFNRDLGRMILEDAQYSVTTAVDGLDALKEMARQKFDVVLMDMQMPIMDGCSACRIIRASEQGRPAGGALDPELSEKLINQLTGRHLTIIAMTANAMHGDKGKCLQAGMDDYLTKPLLPEHVLSAIQRMIGTDDNNPNQKQ